MGGNEALLDDASALDNTNAEDLAERRIDILAFRDLVPIADAHVQQIVFNLTRADLM